MNVAHSVAPSKIEKLVDLAMDLQEFVDEAAAAGESLYEAEKGILAKVLKMGHLATDRFLQLQGDGDLGPRVETEDGMELQRSESPIGRPLRSVFGEHVFYAYVYVPGPKQKIALRPIDARVHEKRSLLFTAALWTRQRKERPLQ